MDSKGSSPGRPGFKMAVDSSGNMFGSIGGGFMEHNLVEECKELSQKSFYPFLKQQVHRKQAPENQSGLNCSGEQTIAFYFLNSDNYTTISEDQTCLVLDQQGINFTNESPSFRVSFEQNTHGWIYKENLKFKNQLYIVGGGHVSLAFSRIMKTLDFEITLIDNREGLNTFEDNKYVDHKLIYDYTKINEVIPEGDNIYITVMSFGYTTDELALKCLIGKRVKYLGSMGSKAKIRKLKNNLKREEFDKEAVDDIYAPIGISISSKTPEEIAVSIAAEIIKVKNEPK